MHSPAIPFDLRRASGHIDVVIEPNADPSGLGCGLLAEEFDAPFRGSRADLDWEAHSYLCISPDAVMTKTVRATTGFRWGFRLEGGVFTIREPEILRPDDWTGHVPLLAAMFPAWTFAAGFHSQ